MFVFRKDGKRQMSPQNREKVRIMPSKGRFLAAVSKVTREEMLTVSEGSTKWKITKKVWLSYSK